MQMISKKILQNYKMKMLFSLWHFQSPDRICVRAALSRSGWRRTDRRYEVRIAATDACGNRSEEVSIGKIRVLRRLRDAPQCAELTVMPRFDRIFEALSKQR